MKITTLEKHILSQNKYVINGENCYISYSNMMECFVLYGYNRLIGTANTRAELLNLINKLKEV